MIKKLRELLGLCEHKYVLHKEGDVTSRGVVVGRYYDKSCNKCGKMKRYQFEV